MYEKLNLFNGTILNSQHLAHIEDGIANNSKAVEKNVAVAVETSYNSHTHVITFNVKNALGEIISTSTIDLPTESAIININDIVINGKKYLRFTTVNGSTFDVEMDEMFVNLVNEETFSNAIQNINEQISQLQTDVSNSKNDISNLKSFAENTNKSLANLEQTDIITNKRLANLESATLDFIEDSTIAYSKTVPENALPYAEVTKIGGMTRKSTNLATPFNIGYNMDDVTGEVFKDDKAVATTDMIAVNIVGDNTYTWSNIVSIFTSGVYFYNTNKEYLGRCGATYREQLIINKELLIANLTNIGGEIAYIRLWQSALNSGETIDLLTKQPPMINEGSTALPYEPYFEGLRSAPVSELVSEGENLASMVNGTYKLGTNFEATFTDGHIDLKIMGYGELLSTVWGSYTQRELPIGTYTLGFNVISPSSNPSAAMYIYVDDEHIGTIRDATNSKTFTLNKPSIVKYGFYEYHTDGIAKSKSIDVILNKGETLSTYRPYFKRTLPIPEAVRPAHGINENVYDYIEWCEDGTRKKHIKCGVVVFNGTEGWLNPIDSETNKCFRLMLSAAKINGALCSHFNYMSAPYSLPSGTTGVFGWESSYSVVYFASGHSTVEEWKDYLAEQYANGTPVTVIYALPTPEVTDISDILTDDNFIEVEGGGSITAVNEFGYDVPTTINYATDIGE